MNSKELIIKTLQHEKLPRVPVDFGSTMVTGIHVSCIYELRKYYGLEEKLVKVVDPYQMLGEVDEELKNIIGIDVEGVNPLNNMFGFPNQGWKEWQMPDGLTVLVPERFNTTSDGKGGFYIYPEGDMNAPASAHMPKDSFFFDTLIRQEPILESELDPADNQEEFRLLNQQELAYFENQVKQAANTGRAVLLNVGGTGFGDIALVPAPFLKYPKGIRDIEEWYISTLTRQEYIHKIFEKQLEIALQNLALVNERMGDKIDILYVCGTDFGTQTSTFLSVDTFQSLYAPYYKGLNDWVHTNTNWKTFKHSCGAVEPLIRSFIEAGFDILNPVQVSATGMEADYLKQEYGQNITFWGGGVDTQQALPFRSPDEVKRQVSERLSIFSEQGGFVFNTIHNIQAKTPVENIVAMIEAVQEFNQIETA